MTTYQFITTAPGLVQSRSHLGKTSCTRMSLLSLFSPAGRDGRASASEGKRVGLGEGRVRVPLDISVMQASTPHLNPLPFSEGRGDRNRLSNRSFR
jgi:hypothetical protein